MSRNGCHPKCCFCYPQNRKRKLTDRAEARYQGLFDEDDLSPTDQELAYSKTEHEYYQALDEDDEL
jgi:hypothetical protein